MIFKLVHHKHTVVYILGKAKPENYFSSHPEDTCIPGLIQLNHLSGMV